MDCRSFVSLIFTICPILPTMCQTKFSKWQLLIALPYKLWLTVLIPSLIWSSLSLPLPCWLIGPLNSSYCLISSDQYQILISSVIQFLLPTRLYCKERKLKSIFSLGWNLSFRGRKKEKKGKHTPRKPANCSIAQCYLLVGCLQNMYMSVGVCSDELCV